jgi:phosphoribosyl-ATP pyrophosphohydrolase/phosphoribosyl-AMP cyclohydrolase
MTSERIEPGAVALVLMVVQDADTGTVLMVGYGNDESLAASVASGQVHFWSRSRDELWRKGATSGNTLELVGLLHDCDGDAVLVLARPAGPTCHTGSTSCFESDGPPFAALGRLHATIKQRLVEQPDDSYTVGLVAGGVDAVGRKLIEEATEVLIAAKDNAAGDSDVGRVAEEVADLLYHLLVLMAERAVEPGLVAHVLDERSR